MFKPGFDNHHQAPDAVDELRHPRLGDLSGPMAVNIAGKALPEFHLRETPFAFVHLSVTGRCQARCKGCINASFSAPDAADRLRLAPIADTRPERDAACILALLEQQKNDNAAICFYGGEPLLAADKIATVAEIIEKTPRPRPIRYMLYTNGELLEQSVRDYPGLMQSIWLLSVSIDGSREQHEAARPGTHLDRIHAGLAALKKIRPGATLMWSTLREEQSLADCFAEFRHLLRHGLATQFFWHWVETKEPYADFAGYARRYETELAGVMNAYIEALRKGTVLPLVHVNELVLYILGGKTRNSSGCGVELAANYDLLDGRIHSCADLPPELAIGHIDDQGNPHLTDTDLSALLVYKDELGCEACGVHAYCGGRCPVQAQIGSSRRLRQYCQLMRLHVAVVLEYIDDITVAMAKQAITPQDLYDRSALYAQFTDVTP